MGQAARPHIHPLTSDRWKDLCALFESSPVTRACWCMWPRVHAGTMHARTAEQNRDDLRTRVEQGVPVGLIAYAGPEPVAWCSIGPVSDYARFAGAADDNVWLIGCLFTRRERRGEGLGWPLLQAAVDYAAANGATGIEGPPRGWRPDDDPASLDAVMRLFRGAGFHDTPDPGVAGLLRREAGA